MIVKSQTPISIVESNSGASINGNAIYPMRLEIIEQRYKV